MNDIPFEIQNDVIKNAFDKAEFAIMPKREQENYHKNLKVYRDLINSYDFARDEGLQEGLEKGRQEGITQEKIEIAKKSIEKGLDIETIVMITGLEKDTINKLCQK